LRPTSPEEIAAVGDFREDTHRGANMNLVRAWRKVGAHAPGGKWGFSHFLGAEASSTLACDQPVRVSHFLGAEASSTLACDQPVRERLRPTSQPVRVNRFPWWILRALHRKLEEKAQKSIAETFSFA
jgi:hypothetical protein